MSEIVIPLDIAFAEKIDLNCNSCQAGAGNSTQLYDLNERERLSDYPLEKRALGLFVQKCIYCLKDGNPLIDSLSATQSCSYRTGISM